MERFVIIDTHIVGNDVLLRVHDTEKDEERDFRITATKLWNKEPMDQDSIERALREGT